HSHQTHCHCHNYPLVTTCTCASSQSATTTITTLFLSRNPTSNIPYNQPSLDLHLLTLTLSVTIKTRAWVKARPNNPLWRSTYDLRFRIATPATMTPGRTKPKT